MGSLGAVLEIPETVFNLLDKVQGVMEHLIRDRFNCELQKYRKVQADNFS